jgi:hypothetical protein
MSAASMSTGFITRHKSVGSYLELKIRSKNYCRIIISRRFSADPKYFSILHLIEAASEKLGVPLWRAPPGVPRRHSCRRLRKQKRQSRPPMLK